MCTHKLKHTRLTAGQEDLGVNIDGNNSFFNPDIMDMYRICSRYVTVFVNLYDCICTIDNKCVNVPYMYVGHEF